MAKMNKLASVALLLPIFLAGCDDNSLPTYAVDQPMRRAYFMECLKSLPAGPTSTQYNDWDEVVAQCDSVAYYQAKYCIENCQKAEMRWPKGERQ
jgi:hypothetical protein